MKRLPSFGLIIVLSILASCRKGESPGDTNVPPSNLTISAVVSNDNSGNVSFTASAMNAVTYDFDYGNGIFQTVASGIVTYKYPSSGTYTVNVIAKSASGQTVSRSIQVTVTVALSLLWSDEFEIAGLPDPAKWGYDLGAGGWGNAELQHYTSRAENAAVSNGTLKITARAENYSGSSYTSARLLSKDKFSFKYGKVEARAKLPVGTGTWPAIWMLGNNINTVGWPACGEIDIMEYKGSQPDKIYGTLHHPGHSGGNPDGSAITILNAASEFHRYGLEWSASVIKISVDDVVYFSFNNSAGLPFNQNFFLILNVAMGGTFGGPVDPSFSSASMEIDYIRVYQ